MCEARIPDIPYWFTVAYFLNIRSKSENPVILVFPPGHDSLMAMSLF